MKLGDRMKEYEKTSAVSLVSKVPVMVRVDGRAFHTLTKRLKLKGWSEDFSLIMWKTAIALCENLQNVVTAYAQSDEISILMRDDYWENSQPWFGNKLQKVASLAASIATVNFYKNFVEKGFDEQTPILPTFDARAFNLPVDEIVPYFIWRQNDCTRNAVLMAGRFYFSQKELHGLKCNQVQEKLFQEKDINFNDYSIPQKRGVCIVKNTYYYQATDTYRGKWETDLEIPIFSKDPDYIPQGLSVA